MKISKSCAWWIIYYENRPLKCRSIVFEILIRSPEALNIAVGILVLRVLLNIKSKNVQRKAKIKSTQYGASLIYGAFFNILKLCLLSSELNSIK